MALLGKSFQVLSTNKIANAFARSYGLKFGAKKFVAGKDVYEAIETAKELNEQGISVIFNYLGEFSDDPDSCRETTQKLIETLEVMSEHMEDNYLTVKLSSIGLEISEDFCEENLTRILEAAEKKNVFVRMEMENHTLTDKTLNVYKSLRRKYENVGIALQAYLYRTEKDMQDLYEYEPNIRLVKGAYNESSKIAYADKKEVDQKYLKMIEKQLLNGHFASIATHDDAAVEHALKVIEENNINKENFEFQMLYGIRPNLEKKLADLGYKVRVYLPFGSEWFGYFMRRLAERPENVSFVIKNTLKKGA